MENNSHETEMGMNREALNRMGRIGPTAAETARNTMNNTATVGTGNLVGNEFGVARHGMDLRDEGGLLNPSPRPLLQQAQLSLQQARLLRQREEVVRQQRQVQMSRPQAQLRRY